MELRMDGRDLPCGAEHESRIVWVDPAWSTYPYLREKAFFAGRRKGAPKKSLRIHVVGYAELGPAGQSKFKGTFERRCWVLHQADFRPIATTGEPNSYSDGKGLIRGSPWEGVLPESIKPGVLSAAALPELQARPRPMPVRK